LTHLRIGVTSPFSRAALVSGMIGPLVVSQCAKALPAKNITVIRIANTATDLLSHFVLILSISFFVIIPSQLPPPPPPPHAVKSSDNESRQKSRIKRFLNISLPPNSE